MDLFAHGFPTSGMENIGRPIWLTFAGKDPFSWLLSVCRSRLCTRFSERKSSADLPSLYPSFFPSSARFWNPTRTPRTAAFTLPPQDRHERII